MHPTYSSRIETFQRTIKRLSADLNRIGLIRLVLFLVAVAGIVVSVRMKQSYLLLIPLAALSLFLWLVRLTARVRQQLLHHELLVEINNQEIKALSADYTSFDPGTEYTDYTHAYSYDLDLFGEHSLFRMLNRTGTPLGKTRLAELLKDPGTDPETIRLRQEAIKELVTKIDWRQHMLATARAAKWENTESRSIGAWLMGADHFRNNRLLKLFTLINPLLIFLLILFISLNLKSSIFLLYLLIPAGVVLIKTRAINREQQKVERLLDLFRKYRGMLDRIEKEEFTAELNKKLQQGLLHREIPASLVMNRLTTILWGLEVRGNLLVASLLNLIFVWDIRMMIRLERWRQEHREDFNRWIGIIAEYEALSSLASFAMNRPDCHYPEILEGKFRMSLEQAGHPLIDPSRRIDNSIDFDEHGQIYLITGANMAGKSTLLRTVGVNMILAQCGAPVCARRMAWVPVTIHTSVRTHDSLGDDESYFYAELKKLNRIISVLQEDRELFVIIDEMLKGTNSRDKHAGSAALIRRLLSLPCSGLVATHDVELGALEEENPGRVVNRCFEVNIEGNQLFFDYILRPGVSKSLNATFLMKKMGIIVDSNPV